MNNIFDRINSWITGVEGSVVNLVSALAPWGAPLVPGMMTYIHVTEFLFPQRYWLGFVAAFVIWALGLSTIRTALDFWAHNRKYEKSEKYHVPLWVPIACFIFYMLTTIVTNIVLEVEYNEFTRTTAIALLTLQEIPAGMILAVRATHNRLKKEAEDRYKRPHRKRKQPQVKEPVLPDNGHPIDVSAVMEAYLERERITANDIGRGKPYSPTDIALELGLNPNSIRSYVHRAKRN